jgi:hypothetical protein
VVARPPPSATRSTLIHQHHLETCKANSYSRHPFYFQSSSTRCPYQSYPIISTSTVDALMIGSDLVGLRAHNDPTPPRLHDSKFTPFDWPMFAAQKDRISQCDPGCHLSPSSSSKVFCRRLQVLAMKYRGSRYSVEVVVEYVSYFKAASLQLNAGSRAPSIPSVLPRPSPASSWASQVVEYQVSRRYS